MARVTRAKRVGVIYSDLGDLPIAALEYLVLHVNTFQKQVEFEFLPIPITDPFLASLAPGSVVPEDTFQAKLSDFVTSLPSRLARMSEAYGVGRAKPDRYVVITLASLDTHWYEIWEDKYSVILLGDWELTMAPPSLLEFIITLVIIEGLLALLGSAAEDVAHLATRGCIGDFTSALRHVRYKTLQGFICAECRSHIAKQWGQHTINDWTAILSKSWLGKLDDPYSPASIVSKLGYNLFVTKGMAPTRWEKTLQILREDGVKEGIKLVGGILLAALLFYLGLKK